MTLSLTVAVERWPVAGAFTIARGSRTEVVAVVATLADGDHIGRGECVPYARYGETVEGVVAAIEAMRAPLVSGLGLEGLQSAMPPGAARNALDCALWDLQAKRAGTPAYALAGLPSPQPLVTAYTISLGDPGAMAEAAGAAASRALLKIKLGGAGDPERIRAVREAAPAAELIVDANEVVGCRQPRRQPRCMRPRWRDHDRAALARRGRRRAGAHRAAYRYLRGRKPA